MRNDWYLKRVEAEKQYRITIVAKFRAIVVTYMALSLSGFALAISTKPTIDLNNLNLTELIVFVGLAAVFIVMASKYFIFELERTEKSQKKLDDIKKFQQKFIGGKEEDIKIEFENLKLYE